MFPSPIRPCQKNMDRLCQVIEYISILCCNLCLSSIKSNVASVVCCNCMPCIATTCQSFNYNSKEKSIVHMIISHRQCNALYFLPLQSSLSQISHIAKKQQKKVHIPIIKKLQIGCGCQHALPQHIKASTTMNKTSCIQQQQTLSYNLWLGKIQIFPMKEISKDFGHTHKTCGGSKISLSL